MLIMKLIEEMNINFKINDIYWHIYVNVHTKSFYIFFIVFLFVNNSDQKKTEIRICQTK